MSFHNASEDYQREPTEPRELPERDDTRRDNPSEQTCDIAEMMRIELRAYRARNGGKNPPWWTDNGE